VQEPLEAWAIVMSIRTLYCLHEQWMGIEAASKVNNHSKKDRRWTFLFQNVLMFKYQPYAQSHSPNIAPMHGAPEDLFLAGDLRGTRFAILAIRNPSSEIVVTAVSGSVNVHDCGRKLDSLDHKQNYPSCHALLDVSLVLMRVGIDNQSLAMRVKGFPLIIFRSFFRSG
jgi:hypothetical protein